MMKRHAMSDWFGPKRIGFGLRPQTWEGWLVVVAVCAAIMLGLHLLLQPGR
jgi:hypothetical protein